MDDIRLDNEIKEALVNETNDIEMLQQSIWLNIENHISSQEKANKQEKPRELNLNKRKTRASIASLFAKIAAVIAFIIIFTNSKPGMAAIGKVKSILVPEKKITQQLEGIESESEVTLKESSAGYTLYIDASYFNLETTEGKEKITPKNKSENTSLPEVYMEIWQVTDKNPSQLLSELESELKTSYKNVTNKNKIDSPLQALNLRANTGVKWNDKVVAYYLVDNKQGGSFVIKQQYFLEAEEGMGARFDNMLKEFRLIE